MRLQIKKCEKCGYENVPIEAKYCPRCRWEFPQNESSIHEDETFSQDNDGLTDYNIVLGKTTVIDLETTFDKTFEQDEDEDYFELEQGVTIHTINSPAIFGLCFDDVDNNNLKNILETVFHIQGFNSQSRLKNQLKNVCNKNSWKIKFNDDACAILIPDKRWLILCRFEEEKLEQLFIFYTPKCPNCNVSPQFQIDDVDYHNCWLRCKHCKKKFNFFEELLNNIIVCPNCGSDDFEDDGSGRVQYTCNRCGHIWGDEDDWDNEDEEDCDEDDDEDYDDELHRF